jgi:hypothetical protein
MIGPGDAFDLIDRLAAWLPGALDWLPANVRTYVVVPLVVVVIYLVPRVVVHRVLPWAGRYLVVPVTALVSWVVAAVALVVDFVLARTFRLVGLPLTSVHYAVGDWAIAGSRGVRVGTRYRVWQAGRWLGRFSPVVLLLAAIAITVMWNAGYCDRNPSTGCADPLAQWWSGIRALAVSTWHDMSGA